MRRLPDWFKVKVPSGSGYSRVTSLVQKHKLNTICEEAKCPNIGDCWNKGTATFMILGDVCTRACRYCNVKTGRPLFSGFEGMKIVDSITKLGLKYVVVTSVTRDDLEDQGASAFVDVVEKARLHCPDTKIELLTPDFKADKELIKIVADSKPYVFGHNIEGVRRIHKSIRPVGGYDMSLDVLKIVKEFYPSMITKSGLMVGLGEESSEVVETMKDLRAVGCDVLTIGQYLQPSPKHAKVERFYSPDEFKEFEKIGRELGFKHIVCGPLVRSSYYAEEVQNAIVVK